jgi:ribosomal protein S18 acetylase RimI-like enzyme
MSSFAGMEEPFAEGRPRTEMGAHRHRFAAMREVLVTHEHRNHQLARLRIDKEQVADYFVEELRAGPTPALAWGPHGLVGLAQLCSLPNQGGRLGLSLSTLRHLVLAPGAQPPVVRRLWSELRGSVVRRPALVTARLPASDRIAVAGLIDCGFEYVGGEMIGILRPSSVANDQRSVVGPRVVPLDRNLHLDAVARLAATCHPHNQYAYQRRLSRTAVAQIYRDLVVAQTREPNTQILVALDADLEVCGFISTKVNRKLETFAGRRLGTLDFIVVSPGARARGVGDALNRAALNRLAGLGVEAATVRTMMTNFPALAVLRKIGFEITASNIILHGWME